MTSVFAPPCSGPFSAPMAPVTAECTSVSVAAATRAANVDALNSWSACSTSATSNARASSALGRLPGQHVEEVRGVARAPGPDRSMPPPLASRPQRRDDRSRPAPSASRSCGIARRATCRWRPDRSATAPTRACAACPSRSTGGSDRIRRSTPSGRRRDAASCDCSSPSSARLGRSSVPQQIADFLERRVLGEIVDVVAAIRQHAALAVQITDGRGRDDDVFEAGFAVFRWWPLPAMIAGLRLDRVGSRRRLLTIRDLRLQHDAVAGELLDDREQAGVEEADLEEHEERQRAVDAVARARRTPSR